MAAGSISETTFTRLTQILIKQNTNQTGESKKKAARRETEVMQ